MCKAAYVLFLATLIFAPMAFGTVEAWAYTLMELMICASAIFLYFSNRQNRFYQVPGIIPLLLIGGVILFQVIPLPAGLVRLISPESHAIYQNTLGAVAPVHWMPISIYPRATLMAFVRFSSYVLFYVIAIQFLSNAALLKKNLAVLASFGALLAFFVIIEFFARIMNYPLPHDKILWIRDSVYGAGSVGPYVNRNHYAGLAEMLFPLALAMFLVYRPVMAHAGFKKWLADIFLQKRISLHFLYGTAAILIGTSLFVTLSRGGIISLTLSMGLFSLFLILKTTQKRVGWGLAIIFVMILSLTGTEAWDMIFERFGNIRNEAGEIWSGRFIYWGDSTEIIRDFPLFGTGAGTFENIYPKYRTYPGNALLEHAHNDYLEFLSTGGIIIPGLMLAALAVILYKSFLSYRRRREGYAIYLFVGCLAAVLSILLHSFVDFNMQVGANGLYFFLVLALAVSASNTRFRNGLPATYLKHSTLKFHIPLLAAFCLGLGVLYVNFGTLLGNLHFSHYRNADLSADRSFENLSKIHQAAHAAAECDSLNPAYYQVLANTSAMMGRPTQALDHYETLLRLAPLNSQYLQDAGYFLSSRGDHDKADQLMRTAIDYDHNNVSTYLNYAAWLFEKKQVDKGLHVLKSAMQMKPGATDTCLTLMVWFGLNDNRMQFALPDRVLPHLEFADYLLSKGYKNKAEISYLEALDCLPNEDEIKKGTFLKVYRFYHDEKKYEKALQIIKQAIQHFPNDHRLHQIAGNLYKKLGITYRAEEEYRKFSILKAN
jgi:O-antigen ligase/Flp pilus assembly protein TadD